MLRILNLISFISAPFLTAILLILSFPRYDYHCLAWIAYVPLLLAIQNRKPWQSFFIGWLCGFVFFVCVSPWVRDFPGINKFSGSLGYLYLSLYFGLFCLFLTLILRRTRLPLLIAAPILVSFEYARCNFFFLAFPTILLGHTQYLNLPLIQIASFTGAYGISFILMLANAAIADLIGYLMPPSPSACAEAPADSPSLSPQGRGHFVFNPLYRGGFVLIMILVLWVAGYISLPPTLSGKSFTVAVIQGNIPQELKWNREYRDQILTQYENLTEEAGKNQPRLIVWPEASTPGFVLSDRSLLERMDSIVRHVNTYLLAGSAEYPKFGKRTITLKSGNTALFFSPEGKVIGQYLKIRLVPFGEYVPWEETIPWPDFIVSKKRINFHTAGNEFTLFGIEETKFGALICWEVLFPDLSRSFVRKGADFLINLSNEAWFGKSDVPYQILSFSVFRAVENRVNLVRCTNTGISCFIDPYGRIMDRVTNGNEDIFVAGTLTKEILISPAGTFYTCFGDVFAYGCIILSIALLIGSFFGKSLFIKGK
ncbi:MAG: apolipoprotein N-acyltransferase [Deltaproteobacteria bacterium]|nr:apolipoprotein N-acyltransferase [Deltaproteobacteria bacterium]